MKMNKILKRIEQLTIALLIPVFGGGVLPVWRATRRGNNQIFWDGTQQNYTEAVAQMTSELYLQHWLTLALLFLLVLYAGVTRYRSSLKRSFIWGAGISVPGFILALLTHGFVQLDGGGGRSLEEYQRTALRVNRTFFFLFFICYFSAYFIQRAKGQKQAK